MLAVKIFNRKENRDSEFMRTIKTIVSHIYGKLSFKETRVVSDNEGVEIISGDDIAGDEDQIVAELMIRKTFVINTEDFNDREKLDKFMSEIKFFCDKAKEIEEQEYYPVSLRNIK